VALGISQTSVTWLCLGAGSRERQRLGVPCSIRYIWSYSGRLRIAAEDIVLAPPRQAVFILPANGLVTQFQSTLLSKKTIASSSGTLACIHTGTIQAKQAYFVNALPFCAGWLGGVAIAIRIAVTVAAVLACNYWRLCCDVHGGNQFRISQKACDQEAELGRHCNYSLLGFYGSVVCVDLDRLARYDNYTTYKILPVFERTCIAVPSQIDSFLLIVFASLFSRCTGAVFGENKYPVNPEQL
jgi:hypothetical protein